MQAASRLLAAVVLLAGCLAEPSSPAPGAEEAACATGAVPAAPLRPIDVAAALGLTAESDAAAAACGVLVGFVNSSACAHAGAAADCGGRATGGRACHRRAARACLWAQGNASVALGEAAARYAAAGVAIGQRAIKCRFQSKRARRYIR